MTLPHMCSSQTLGAISFTCITFTARWWLSDPSAHTTGDAARSTMVLLRKKSPKKTLETEGKVKKLVIKVLKSSSIDLHPRLPQLYYPLCFLFWFGLVWVFCESQNNCVKNMLISISLYYFCSFFIWIFFSRIELNFVNLCSLGCTWEFSSYFGLKAGDEEEPLDPNGNLWGFPHTTSCQSHALY